MVPRAAIIGALILSASCSKTEGGDLPSTAVQSGSAARAGSGSSGGFSASLAKELGAGGVKDGSGTGKPSEGSAGRASGSDAEAKSGSAVAPVAMSGSDAVKDGSASSPPGSSKASGSGAAKPGDAPRVAEATPGAQARPGDAPKAGSAAAPARPDGPSSPGPTKPGEVGKPPEAGKPAGDVTKPGDAAKPAGVSVAPVAPARPVPSEAHGPVRVPAELAAIKLSLLPNWDRDVDEAGTFQYVVRIKGTQNTKTFVFRYGYDDAKAPADRDQYKKYLQDSRLLGGELKDRQRGSAWFLEGVDATGSPAFRYVVLYGGKRLICYGSLYKDAESGKLGDDRDQTVIQAKQICETLAL